MSATRRRAAARVSGSVPLASSLSGCRAAIPATKSRDAASCLNENASLLRSLIHWVMSSVLGIPACVVETGAGGDASEGFSAKTPREAIAPQTSATITPPANHLDVALFLVESPTE